MTSESVLLHAAPPIIPPSDLNFETIPANPACLAGGTSEKPNTYIKESFLSIILAHSYRWQIILAEVGLRFSNGVPFVYNLISKVDSKVE
jgi:hypothetical protein